MNLENKTDEELISFAKQNGHKDEIFTKIYNRYKKMILDFSAFLCKNQTLAEDLTQETFIKVYLNLETYNKKNGATFKTWIYTIAKNVLMDYYRKKNILNNAEDLLDHKEISSMSDPEKLLIDKERMKNLEKEIGSLKEIYKEILNLRILGFKYHEIKDRLNIAESSARGYNRLTKQLLRKKLDRDFFY